MTRVLAYVRHSLKTIIAFSGQSLPQQKSQRLQQTLRHCYHSYQSCEPNERLLTAQEVATALRPFFFVVHPDRFWKYPKERQTNEDSLKQLNAYILDVIELRTTGDRRMTFFMREDITSDGSEDKVVLKPIHLKLIAKESVNKIVHRILESSQLSTKYLDKIGKTPKVRPNTPKEDFKPNSDSNTHKNSVKSKNLNDFWINFNNKSNSSETDSNFEEFVDFMEKRKIENSLIEWLRENTVLANSRLKTSQPIRQELNRLNDQLIQEMNLKEIIWKDCGWGVSHIRGALKSLNTLRTQYTSDFDVLNGKTLLFGRQTGVTFDGHVILNIEDVRQNWMKMIRNINSFDSDLERLPFIEKTLSGVLRGIEIDHRKFRSSVLVKNYIKQLEKLTTALIQHITKHGLPNNWLPVLDSYQLVVECEAGPLMLSPTGQFIVPASCPAYLLIDFMSENMFKSRLLRDMYINYKSKEINAINECLTQLGLKSIEKDDNVTPDLMMECCQNLIANKHLMSGLLRDSRLRVSHYYSVLLDGEICIPWNFRV